MTIYVSWIQIYSVILININNINVYKACELINSFLHFTNKRAFYNAYADQRHKLIDKIVLKFELKEKILVHNRLLSNKQRIWDKKK